MPVISDVELPSLPQTALHLIELCGRRDADLVEIVEAVSVDAGLAAKVLKIANSAYYGQQYQIATLRKAAVVLGLEYLKVVALGFHLAGASPFWGHLPLSLHNLWQGNLLRACLAHRIACQSSCLAIDCREQAFLVGLLQDLAVPLMAKAIGEPYVGMIKGEGRYTSAELTAQERDCVGEDHATLAGRLCEQWKLPPQISAAIARHHVKPQRVIPPDEPHALWEVGYWVGMVPFREDCQSAPVVSDLRYQALADFGFTHTELAQVFTAAIDEYSRLGAVFDHVLGPVADAPALLRRAQTLITSLSGDCERMLPSETER